MVRCESAGFSLLIVGVDAHIDPAERTVSVGILGEFAISQRADVGIGPYKQVRKYMRISHPEMKMPINSD